MLLVENIMRKKYHASSCSFESFGISIKLNCRWFAYWTGIIYFDSNPFNSNNSPAKKCIKSTWIYLDIKTMCFSGDFCWIPPPLSVWLMILNSTWLSFAVFIGIEFTCWQINHKIPNYCPNNRNISKTVEFHSNIPVQCWPVCSSELVILLVLWTVQIKYMNSRKIANWFNDGRWLLVVGRFKTKLMHTVQIFTFECIRNVSNYFMVHRVFHAWGHFTVGGIVGGIDAFLSVCIDRYVIHDK